MLKNIDVDLFNLTIMIDGDIIFSKSIMIEVTDKMYRKKDK